MTDTNCKNRRMRIEVADGDQGRGGRGGARERGPNEPDRTMGDWRSGPRIEADSSSDRDGYRSGPRREYGTDRGGAFMDRDRRGVGGFRDDDRDRGGFRDRPGYRDNRGGFRDDRGGGGGDWFQGRSSYNDDRRGFDDRDRRPEYGVGDNKSTWRRDAEPPREVREKEPPVAPVDKMVPSGEPKTRTKLNLQPRSRPVEEKVNGTETPVTPPVSVPVATAASIFGGARPVDTAAREREIEERLAKQREDRPIVRDARDEIKPVSQIRVPPIPRDPAPTRDDPPSSPPLEPAPPPKENVWTRRSQQTSPPQINNGRISPHENGDMHKNKNSSLSNESRKYQPPQRNAQEDKKRDGGQPKGSNVRGGTGPRPVETKPPPSSKTREQRKELSDETIRMPKVQEHQAPNFVGSNKYAFLEDSESAAD